MGRDHAFKTFARTGALLGLAAATTMGMFGVAGAAPADRATDPVVLKGSALPSLTGTATDRVIAYKWDGSWVQVPVQIDERHTVDARGLYPDVAPAYVNNDVGFPVEIYADAKTRSGADKDKNFDSDDELVFMGGDSGSKAPASAVEPAGVVGGSGTAVTVNDPVGGGDAFVYLFKTNKSIDQSAGKDYVSYEFKLTNFGPNDTLIDNYGFSNSNNPEDSTVKTDNYELHSTDRWNEDQLKITAGGASGINILDREAVSAGGLGKCSRSEYTFSGNWNRGSDNDEGTYLAIKDGPVRAIRAYMGANSGPYVEDVHLYYVDREDRSINVRVHPIPDMTVWTDYNESAVGMTYRDQKNTAGVNIDGVPDTLDPATMADFENGKYLWQQVSGAQGTTTSMVSAQSSANSGGIFNFGFTGYYLDNVNPSSSSNDKERQCGGDMKAYGASGFGINGTYPNTDPIMGTEANPADKLSVTRVRYFSGPSQTAADAEAFKARAQGSLAGTAGKANVKPRSAKLKVAAQGKPKAKVGKKAKIKLKVTNTGTAASKKGKVCITGKAIGKSCKSVPALAVGKSKPVTLTPKVKKNAKGKSASLKAQVTAAGAKANAKVKLALKR